MVVIMMMTTMIHDTCDDHGGGGGDGDGDVVIHIE